MKSRALVVAPAALVCVAALSIVSCAPRSVTGGAQELALANAAKAHNAAEVQRLLDAGANPNHVVQIDDRWRSPWGIALDELRPRKPELVAIVKAMLKARASTSIVWDESPQSRMRGSYQLEPIAVAMLHPDADVIHALIEAGLDLRHGEQALVSAIESGDIDVAHVLVDAGVNPNTNVGAITPLIAAVQARDLALVTYLEAHGAREKP